MRRITIFDTTLRDGEQAPGAALSHANKVRFAETLADLGVDIIEAGFPVASDGEAAAVREIATKVRTSGVAALARASDKDIDLTLRAIEPSVRPVLHTFIGTSPTHLEFKLRITKEQALERIDRAVRRAKDHVAEVEFSCEDATRTDIDFLHQAHEVAVAAGATSVNVPDTVGYRAPNEFAALIRDVRARLPKDVRLSVHCHNDLGLATANTLAAVEAGADQVQVTMNGMGERGGNASLEEVVMAIRCRADWFDAETRIETTKLVPASRLFSEITGIPVQPNKAIVGANAFAHASGIHQDGVLKHPETYEIMTPESVGWAARRIVVGKLSGRRGVAARLSALGIALEGDALDRAYVLAMRRGDEVQELSDKDMVTIAAQARRTAESAETVA